MRSLQNELKVLRATLAAKELELVKMKKQFDNEHDEKMSLVEEKDRELTEWEVQRMTWHKENEVLRQQVQEMIEMAKKEESGSYINYFVL